MLQSKLTVMEMESAFGGIVDRLETAKERTSELEGMTAETSKTDV